MKREKTITTFTAAMLLIASQAAMSAVDVQDQINELKDEILILQDQLEESNTASTSKMNISGYADIEYHNNDATGEEPGFRLHHMSLFFEKRISDDWKFFSEVEYEDAPFFEFKDQNDPTSCSGCYGKIFLEAANFTYSWLPEMGFRGGRFFTPAGIWSVNHYPSFTPTQLRPGHVRKIFPQVVDGLATFGTIPLGDTFMEYDLYFGNGEGNAGKADGNSSKAAGAKLSFLMPYFQFMEFGFSSYSDTLNDDTKKTASGAHVKLKFASFDFQGEYSAGTLKGVASDKEISGYYGQLQYHLAKWNFGIRHDFHDEDSADATDRVSNSAFINYHVNQSIVLKLEHHAVTDDLKNGDYAHTIGSIVLYLGN